MRLSRNVRRFSQPLSIVSCTDKLVTNDPSFVELSLERMGENFDLDRFVQAIRANDTVKHVCFSGTFVRELEPDQWRVMLESVGHLQTLEELQIWCSSIPVGVFARTITHAQALQKVYFFRVGLDGTQDDFHALGQAIRDHSGLRDVRVGGFHITSMGAAGGGADHINAAIDAAANIRLDSVVEALAYAQHLEVVSLQLSSAQQTVPFGTAAMAKLFQSKSITDLYLSRLGLGRQHLTVITQELMNNNTLRVLDLFGNNIENQHVIAMANALKVNDSLEILVLPCPADDLSVPSCAAISDALKVNKRLSTLNLPRSNLSDQGISHLAEGLTVNTTLKKVEVGVSKNVSDKGMNALLSMLENNYELERVVVSSADHTIKEKTEYYMRLNEVGRGNLLRSGKATREQWVDMLISVIDDLDCLFYFLGSNPTLCQFANPTMADVIVTEEIKIARRHTLGGIPSSSSTSSTNKDPRRASAY